MTKYHAAEKLLRSAKYCQQKRSRSKSQEAIAKRELKYCRKNLRRMNYREFRQRGLPIGSGPGIGIQDSSQSASLRRRDALERLQLSTCIKHARGAKVSPDVESDFRLSLKLPAPVLLDFGVIGRRNQQGLGYFQRLVNRLPRLVRIARRHRPTSQLMGRRQKGGAAKLLPKFNFIDRKWRDLFNNADAVKYMTGAEAAILAAANYAKGLKPSMRQGINDRAIQWTNQGKQQNSALGAPETEPRGSFAEIMADPSWYSRYGGQASDIASWLLPECR